MPDAFQPNAKAPYLPCAINGFSLDFETTPTRQGLPAQTAKILNVVHETRLRLPAPQEAPERGNCPPHGMVSPEYAATQSMSSG